MKHIFTITLLSLLSFSSAVYSADNDGTENNAGGGKLTMTSLKAYTNLAGDAIKQMTAMKKKQLSDKKPLSLFDDKQSIELSAHNNLKETLTYTEFSLKQTHKILNEYFTLAQLTITSENKDPRDFATLACLTQGNIKLLSNLENQLKALEMFALSYYSMMQQLNTEKNMKKDTVD